MPGTSFDFAGFRRAFVEQDVSAWAAYFAPDGEWIEYRHANPPRSPRVMSGRQQIAEFLARVKSSNVTLEIGDEVVGPQRAAFRVWCTLPDGRRIIEHVIIHYSNGRITRQVDVEAWD
jgi:ketosteroid isomerase-like protein